MLFTLRLIIIILLACVAASGTFPFGWRFAAFIPTKFNHLHFIVALLFASTATLANAALGTYSLLHTFHNRTNSATRFLSLAAAIPMGFICFAGYEPIMSIFANILISLAVVGVNAAINDTALKNAASGLIGVLKLGVKNLIFTNLSSMSPVEFLLRILGICIGILVSTTISLASIDRLVTLLAFTYMNKDFIWIVSCFIGILLWIPNAALFANSTQQLAAISYKILQNLRTDKTKMKNINFSTKVLLVFTGLSGGAFAQMILEFTAVNRHIPLFLKTVSMQIIIHTIIMPLGFIATAAVNLIAIHRLIPIMKNQVLSNLNRSKINS